MKRTDPSSLIAFAAQINKRGRILLNRQTCRKRNTNTFAATADGGGKL